MSGERERMLALCDTIQAANEEMRHEIDAAFPVPPQPVPDIVVKVALGESPQKAFNSLLETGGIIKLAPGKHTAGELKIPERPDGAKLITVTSDSTNLPGPGQRITPEYAEALGIIMGVTNTTAPLNCLNKSRNVAFVNMGFGPPLTSDYAIIQMGGDKRGMPTPDLRPDGFLFDRVFAYGDPVKGARRGLQPNAVNVQLINSHIKDCIRIGGDSQAVGAWNGAQNIFIKNCHLEGGAENVMFGGSDCASVEMIPQDIVIDGCTLAKVFNDAWKAASIKCIFEIKNVKKLTLKNSLLENNWVRDWSTGVALMLKCANQEGGNPYATCEDVIIQNLIIRNVGSVFGMIGKNDANKESDWMKRITIENILAHTINVAPWTGTGRGCEFANGAEEFFQLNHVTMQTNAHSWLNFRTDSGLLKSPGQLIVTNSVVAESSYGYLSAKNGIGYAAADKDWTGMQIEGNAFKQGTRPQGTLPPNNLRVPPANWDASFGPDHAILPDSAVAQVQTTDGKLPGVDLTQLPS